MKRYEETEERVSILRSILVILLFLIAPLGVAVHSIMSLIGREDWYKFTRTVKRRNIQ
jgi:hypothetical protein